MGGGQICFCIALFWGGGGGEEKHINKFPTKSQENAGTVPGQSREKFVYV